MPAIALDEPLLFQPYAKRADLGGDGKDTDFERSFAEMAHARVRDRAPGLMEFQVGFQLLDRNEEGNRAAAVFGFKVGPEWLYVPSFFLRGEVKGHELLYMKSKDRFVPLKENWVNYILQKRPQTLGTSSPTDQMNIGVMPPDLRSFIAPPYKSAAWIKDAIDVFKRAAKDGLEKGASAFSLADVIKEEGWPVIETLVQSMQAFPKFASAYEKTYGLDSIQKAIDTAKSREEVKYDILAKDSAAIFKAPAHNGPSDLLRLWTDPDEWEKIVPPGMAVSIENPSNWRRKAAVAYTQPSPTGDFLRGLGAGAPVSPSEMRPPDYRVGGGGLGSPQRPGLPPSVEAGVGVGQLPDRMTGGVGGGGTPNAYNPNLNWQDHLKNYASSIWNWSKQNPIHAGAIAAAPFAMYGLHQMMSRPKKRSVMPEYDDDVEKFAAASKAYAEMPQSVRVVTSDSVTVPGVLASSTKDKEEALRNGMVIEDLRAESDKSIAYRMRTELCISNPQETGIYRVLTRAGTFEKCFVAVSPVSDEGRENISVVVSKDDGKIVHLTAYTPSVWVRQEADDPRREIEAWSKDYPTADKVIEPDYNAKDCPTADKDTKPDQHAKDCLTADKDIEPDDSAKYMIVLPSGDATAPFEVRGSVDYHGDVCLKVKFSCCPQGREPSFNENRIPKQRRRPWDAGPERCDRIRFTERAGAKLVTADGCVHVPLGSKLITLIPKRKKSTGSPSETGARAFEREFALGDASDLRLLIEGKTAALKIKSDPLGHVDLNGIPFRKDAALLHLVRDWGLSIGQSEALVKEACSSAGVAECRVWPSEKAALQQYDLQQGGPSAPPFPPNVAGSEQTIANSVPAQYPMEQHTPVQALQSQTDANSARWPFKPDTQSMSMASQAGQVGEKNVMDVTSMMSLFNTVQDDAMVDRRLPAMEKGLDQIGRTLFSFYAHGERFQDRYGRKDMPELEELLRSSFESAGDLILYLKQKTVEPFGSGDDSGVDLSDSDF